MSNAAISVERRYVTVPEAAQRLGVSRSLAYELVKQGRIQTVRLGSVLRVPVEALEPEALRTCAGA